jgi:phosphoribosylanthranilate isomerase
MIIKICGLTNLEDALAAAEAGADLLGFNFYPRSPRYLTPQACSQIVSRLYLMGFPVRTVGVFVNEPVESVRAILEECNLDLAQLSGDEPPDDLKGLDGRGYKTLRLASLLEAERYARKGAPPALLLDAFQPGLYGGTGQTGDWESAEKIASRYPILLAGGLHPGNVAQAITQVKPWGVDVASGVESSPGKKDQQAMRDFIRLARQQTQEVSSC